MKTQIIKNFINNKVEKVNRQAGFTLVEALTAIFILTFVVVGLMTVVSDSLFAAKYSKDEITVNYLLQETIDFVRNDRDTSVFLNTTKGLDQAWNDFYLKYANAGCTTGGYGCSLDVNTTGGSLTACPSAGCSYLYLNPDGETYFYSTDAQGVSDKEKTAFRRKLEVQSIEGDQLVVKATITWKNGNLPKTRSLLTTLTKWQ